MSVLFRAHISCTVCPFLHLSIDMLILPQIRKPSTFNPKISPSCLVASIAVSSLQANGFDSCLCLPTSALANLLLTSVNILCCHLSSVLLAKTHDAHQSPPPDPATYLIQLFAVDSHQREVGSVIAQVSIRSTNRCMSSLSNGASRFYAWKIGDFWISSGVLVRVLCVIKRSGVFTCVQVRAACRGSVTSIHPFVSPIFLPSVCPRVRSLHSPNWSKPNLEVSFSMALLSSL